MGITTARIWKNSFFKSVGLLFSSNKNTVKCLIVSEMGVVGLVDLALGNGFATDKVTRSSWIVIQNLKLPMQGVDEPVLPVSERSYKPLDPLGKLSETEREGLESIDSIAATRYSESFNRVEERNNESGQKMLRVILWFMMCITAVVVIILLVK